MALSKSSTTTQTSATNTAGSTATSSTVDLTGSYGALVTGLVTNGGTGPTLPCAMIVQTSNDNFTTTRATYTRVAGTVASTSYPLTVELPVPVMYIRTQFTGNTVQSVTIGAEVAKVPTI